MKRFLAVCLCAVLALSLVACGQQEIPNLEGVWTTDDDTMKHQAEIKDGVIEIYWVNDEDDTKSLYWAGTYVAPADTTEPYTWSSANDTEKTATAFLASTEEEKEFTYEDGVLSYSTSALGTTKTMKLKKQKD